MGLRGGLKRSREVLVLPRMTGDLQGRVGKVGPQRKLMPAGQEYAPSVGARKDPRGRPSGAGGTEKNDEVSNVDRADTGDENLLKGVLLRVKGQSKNADKKGSP